MRKNNYLIFVILLVMTFFTAFDNVNASSFECTYGMDTGSGWEQLIKFSIGDKVEDSNGFKHEQIIGTESPILNKFQIDTFTKATDKEYLYQGVHTDGANDHFNFYISVYPNIIAYNQLMDREGAERCPKVLRYSITKEKMGIGNNGWLTYYIKIFNDSLDQPDDDYSWVLFKDSQEEIVDDLNQYGLNIDTEGYFKEINVKDVPLEELVDEYDCMTYSYAIQGIKFSLSGGKTCDDNDEFNSIYSEIELMCENYRATALYAEEGDKTVVAKSCSKACSMLKDDVSKICNIEYSNGYCGSLGNKIVNWIFKIIRIVRYAIPALLIILSILDYIKALASESEDEMKKVTARFSKRLIAAALIFILPFILDFVLNIFSIPGLNASNPFCAE